ncbi:MAG: hypothetical protein QOG79_3343, partial [Mycobacterium sp.]|nr:hypothetical protein [Mycobacterium sp.]
AVDSGEARLLAEEVLSLDGAAAVRERLG